MPNAVEIENAVVAYREHAALRGVSLAVPEGQLLGVFGPNGAGKTTLLRLINGLVRPTSGTVRVLDHDLGAGSPRVVRTQAGYVPQSLGVDPRIPVSAWEVTVMGRYGRLGILRRPGAADREAARRALEQVGVSHLSHRPFGHLSGGEQQRVVIARALAQEPRLLLLDEPTASLDWAAQRELPELIQAVHRQRGLTTVVVSHDADTVAGLCERVVLMQGGAIVGERDPAAFAQFCLSRPRFETAGEGGRS
ncbi:MAG: ABC transporter ATP-binding protein [Armatimonadota bacterium]|nr:MAG: ABC transporter ATP-binding protein [Armatimonadota bacterium]